MKTRLVITLKVDESGRRLGFAELVLPFFDPRVGDTVGITESCGHILSDDSNRWWRTDGGEVVLEIHCGSHWIHRKESVDALIANGWKLRWDRGCRPGFLKP